MSASTVSGVGPGSALKAGQKGAEDMFLGVEKLVGVRVVRAGIVTTASNVGTVAFSAALLGVTTDYVVNVTCVDSAASTKSAHVTSLTTSGGQLTGFAVYSDSAAVDVHWTVTRINNATVGVA